MLYSPTSLRYNVARVARFMELVSNQLAMTSASPESLKTSLIARRWVRWLNMLNRAANLLGRRSFLSRVKNRTRSSFASTGRSLGFTLSSVLCRGNSGLLLCLLVVLLGGC
jgi:hypothetical protein